MPVPLPSTRYSLPVVARSHDQVPVPSTSTKYAVTPSPPLEPEDLPQDLPDPLHPALNRIRGTRLISLVRHLLFFRRRLVVDVAHFRRLGAGLEVLALLDRAPLVGQ